MSDLEPFVGMWDMEARWPLDRPVPPVEGEVTTTFSWLLGGAYLLQETSAPDPIPYAHCLIEPVPDGAGWRQHYFDSRGVSRVYAMAFDGSTWRLERMAPDFSPLDFRQRYVGTLAADGSSIRGAWEICHDGETWELDFELSYLRRT